MPLICKLYTKQDDTQVRSQVYISSFSKCVLVNTIIGCTYVCTYTVQYVCTYKHKCKLLKKKVIRRRRRRKNTYEQVNLHLYLYMSPSVMVDYTPRSLLKKKFNWWNIIFVNVHLEVNNFTTANFYMKTFPFPLLLSLIYLCTYSIFLD